MNLLFMYLKSLLTKGCSSSDLDLGVNFLYRFIIGFVPRGSINIKLPLDFRILCISSKHFSNCK